VQRQVDPKAKPGIGPPKHYSYHDNTFLTNAWIAFRESGANARTLPGALAVREVQNVVDARTFEEGKPLRNCWHLCALSVAIPLQQQPRVRREQL
jgi:hypothetical protein